LAEISMRENAGLLAYSPLAFGMLSGKYLDGKMPKNARLSLFPVFSRYNSEEARFLTQKYADLAKDLNLSLAQLSLAFVSQQPFVTSNIIGATSMEQLKENIGSIHIKLSEETLKKIDEIQDLQPNPAP
jgi:aryl-alcohol dehydrogenase-like predicted oxidoreductase